MSATPRCPVTTRSSLSSPSGCRVRSSRDTSATCEPKTVSDILVTAEKGQAQRLPFFFWGTDHVFFELRQKRLAGLEEKRGLSPCYPYRRPRTTGNPGARRRAACRRFVIRRTFLRG